MVSFYREDYGAGHSNKLINNNIQWKSILIKLGTALCSRIFFLILRALNLALVSKLNWLILRWYAQQKTSQESGCCWYIISNIIFGLKMCKKLHCFTTFLNWDLFLKQTILYNLLKINVSCKNFQNYSIIKANSNFKLTFSIHFGPSPVNFSWTLSPASSTFR